MKIETKDFTVKFNDDEETKQKVFNNLLEFYAKHEAFSGESICQSDDPQIEAPELLSEIADNIFQFKVDWK